MLLSRTALLAGHFSAPSRAPLSGHLSAYHTPEAYTGCGRLAKSARPVLSRAAVLDSAEASAPADSHSDVDDQEGISLPQYDPSSGQVDLVVAGAGPSGLAVAERVSRAGELRMLARMHRDQLDGRLHQCWNRCFAGFRVCVVDPKPLAVWPNNYGVWVDEFAAMGLEDCLEVVWQRATVFLDQSAGGQRCAAQPALLQLLSSHAGGPPQQVWLRSVLVMDLQLRALAGSFTAHMGAWTGRSSNRCCSSAVWTTVRPCNWPTCPSHLHEHCTVRPVSGMHRGTRPDLCSWRNRSLSRCIVTATDHVQAQTCRDGCLCRHWLSGPEKPFPCMLGPDRSLACCRSPVPPEQSWQGGACRGPLHPHLCQRPRHHRVHGAGCDWPRTRPCGV